MKRIYLDHASVAPTDPRIHEVMQPWLHGAWNPSALHAEGRAARGALDKARNALATLWGLKLREVVFTASGSESVALALLGSADGVSQPGTLWTTSAEHSAVLRCADVLLARGWTVRYLPLDANGLPDLSVLENELQNPINGPRIVSLMLVNNELSTIAPVVQAAEIAHSYGAIFHSDAIAAGETVDILPLLKVADLVSLAAQKCGGPLGVGVLVRRVPLKLKPQIVGGAQEFNLRAGTENIAAIVGAVEAWRLRELEREEAAAHALSLQSYFETQIQLSYSSGETRITVQNVERSPSISHISFAGLDGPSLLAAADLAGLALSAGSACEAGALERSHVAAAIGLDMRWTGLLRFSWGYETQMSEVEEAAKRLRAIVTRMREVQTYER